MIAQDEMMRLIDVKFNGSVRKDAKRFANELYVPLSNCDKVKLAIIRKKLNNDHCAKRGKSNHAFLWIVKQFTDNPLPFQDRHKMTDHCFLRYIERGLGINIDAAKDRALEDIKKYYPTRVTVLEEKYITFI